MSHAFKKGSQPSLQLTQKACSVSKQLLSPKPWDHVVEMLSKNFNLSAHSVSNIVDQLISTGVLLPGDLALRDQTASNSDSYKSLNPTHRYMLVDYHRVEKYRQAIQAAVFPGARVVDVGTGSGILSFFAATYGAERVYSIEATPIIESAKKLAEINKLDQKIEFFHGYAKDFSVEKPVDIIVSEWIGSFVVKEYMFDAVQAVRDRFLASGGQMIPKAVDLFMAPIEAPELYRSYGPGIWEAPYFGYDFSLGKYETPAEYNRCVVLPNSMIAPGARLTHFDCEKDSTSDFHFTKTVEWVVQRNAACHGFVGYFDLILTDTIIMSASPLAPTTSWQQTYFPIDQIFVQVNDVIRLTFTSKPGSDEGPEITIEGAVLRQEVPIATFKKIGRLCDPWSY